MAFWAAIVKPRSPYSHSPDDPRRRLRITQAALEKHGGSSPKSQCTLKCKVGDKKPVILCHLSSKKLSQKMEVEFEEDDDVVFSVAGHGSVHLVGYFVDSGHHPCGHGDEFESHGEEGTGTESDASSDELNILCGDVEAARALDVRNFTTLNGNPRDPSVRISEAANIFIKNLDKSIDHKALHETFSVHGNILSSKVATDHSGQSKGYGFVQFRQEEAAQNAIKKLNGMFLNGKKVYVALAQRKEDRRARLQTQFSQMRPVVMPPAVAPCMPLYPPSNLGFGQQMFFGQGPPAIILAQPLVPGMRPGGAPMPNFFMTMVQQDQQGQRPGGRRGVGPVQQNQQPVGMIQQQMFPRDRVYRHPPGRNMPDVSMPGVPGQMLSVPYDMSAMPVRYAQPISLGYLAAALANATPDQQRTMLGECLYPLVYQIEHDFAAKVTGMLLEMDQTKVLHLLESPDALQAKVAEAMDVLRNVTQQRPLASSPSN